MAGQREDFDDLARFLKAQAGVYEQVIAELSVGEKRSHWMWFIFPQIAGLGFSEMARRFAISGRAEAEAYLAHPTLGARLKQCTAAVNAVEGKEIGAILGYPDNLKFHSSVTLFGAVAPDETVFREALEKYFQGKADSATLARL